MFCTGCEGPLLPGNRFCKQCGATVPGMGGSASQLPGVRAVGAELVIEQPGAPLPPHCVKCGAPTERPPLAQTYAWHSPLVYFLLPSLLLYLIVALIVRKQIQLAVPLCEEHAKKRKTALTVGGLMMAASIPVGIAVGQLGRGGSMALPALIVGALLFFVGGIIVAVGGRVLVPTRIDNQTATFTGASPEFLRQLG